MVSSLVLSHSAVGGVLPLFCCFGVGRGRGEDGVVG